MNIKTSVPIAFMVMLSTTAYGLSSLRLEKSALAQSQSRNYIAEIIRVEGGRVELKRENSQSYSPTQRGERLNLGDLLRVTKGAKIVIQCNFNQTTWTVPDDGLPWGVANTCSPPENRQSS